MCVGVFLRVFVSVCFGEGEEGGGEEGEKKGKWGHLVVLFFLP